jgi:hypothetical protein
LRVGSLLAQPFNAEVKATPDDARVALSGYVSGFKLAGAEDSVFSLVLLNGKAGHVYGVHRHSP